MTYDEWFDTYKPRINLNLPANAVLVDYPHNGTMFETYGDDYESVKQMLEINGDCVWTLLQTDNGEVISNGWHYVNREGYFITTVPFRPTDEAPYLEVVVHEDEDFEEPETSDGDALASAGHGTDEDYGSAEDVL